jgi:hypothetical protein
MVAARIDRRPGHAGGHGGRCNDPPVMDTLNAGVGLETLHAPGSTDWFAGEPFGAWTRVGDAPCYAQPCLVQHIDSTAMGYITDIYRHLLTSGMRVLDLMSSRVSRLPGNVEDLQVTGPGMNAEEPAQNPRTAQRRVHDLNPVLPFADRQFEAAVCMVPSNT